MKTCKVCKEEKDYSEFYKCSSTADKHQSSCKACAKERNKKWAVENKDKRDKIHNTWRQKQISRGYFVYLLPEENYVGATSFPEARKIDHNYRGRNTDGMRILSKFDTADEAYELESFLHDLGYEGRHSSNVYVR